MLAKAIGRDTNIRPGPELGSRPLANTRGKIAMPATSAIMVSSEAMASTVLPMECSPGM